MMCLVASNVLTVSLIALSLVAFIEADPTENPSSNGNTLGDHQASTPATNSGVIEKEWAHLNNTKDAHDHNIIPNSSTTSFELLSTPNPASSIDSRRWMPGTLSKFAVFVTVTLIILALALAVWMVYAHMNVSSPSGRVLHRIRTRTLGRSRNASTSNVAFAEERCEN